MTTSLDEARRYLRIAADDLAAFRALADLAHIRQALAFFHAQQSIEKSLKAVLFVQGIEFRKHTTCMNSSTNWKKLESRYPSARMR